jgi:hypothetical protein
LIRQAERAAGVTPTQAWANLYGPAHHAQGIPLPAGTTVLAVDPDGVTCGATVMGQEGQYGLLACYGDDPDTPEDEGARPGDTIRLLVGEQVLGTGTWSAHGERQWVPLGKAELRRFYLPVMPQKASTGQNLAEEGMTPEVTPRWRLWLPVMIQKTHTGQNPAEGGMTPEATSRWRLWLLVMRRTR